MSLPVILLIWSIDQLCTCSIGTDLSPPTWVPALSLPCFNCAGIDAGPAKMNVIHIENTLRNNQQMALFVMVLRRMNIHRHLIKFIHAIESLLLHFFFFNYRRYSKCK